MGITVNHVQNALSAIKSKYVKSIDTPVSRDGEGRTLGELLPDTFAVSVEDKLDNEKLRSIIIDSLKSLTKREELVLRLRFGIDDITENDNNVYEVQ